MVGLLGYALAGGLAGYGNSLVEEAKAKREAAMEELRNSRLMEREDRQYQRQNARDERDMAFRREEGALTRAQQREMGGSLMQDGDRTVRVIGDTVSPLRNTDGSEYGGQLTPRRTADDRLSKTQIATRIGQVNRDFPDMLNSSANAIDAVASGRDRLTSEGLDDADVNRWTDTALRRAARAEGATDVDRYVSEGRVALGIAEAAAPTISPDPIRLEKGQRPNPADLIDGQSYQLPDGRLGTWSASDGAFASVGSPATAEDARGQSASASAPSQQTPSPPDPKPNRIWEATHGLIPRSIEKLRRQAAGTPERQRAAVMEEIGKLDRLLETGRITKADHERAMARFESDLARLDQENAQ